MPRRVSLHRDAAKAFQRLTAVERRRVKEALLRIADDPFTKRTGADIKRLKGTRGREDLFRVRIGELRAVYAAQREEILVTQIFRRGEGYDV